MGFQPAVKLRSLQRRQADRLVQSPRSVAASWPAQGDNRVGANRRRAVHNIVPTLSGFPVHGREPTAWSNFPRTRGEAVARVEGPVTGNLGQPSATLAAAEGLTCTVDLTVINVAIPYLFSACAQLDFLVSGRRPVRGGLLARDLLVARADLDQVKGFMRVRIDASILSSPGIHLVQRVEKGTGVCGGVRSSTGAASRLVALIEISETRRGRIRSARPMVDDGHLPVGAADSTMASSSNGEVVRGSTTSTEMFYAASCPRRWWLSRPWRRAPRS